MTTIAKINWIQNTLLRTRIKQNSVSSLEFKIDLLNRPVAEKTLEKSWIENRWNYRPGLEEWTFDSDYGTVKRTINCSEETNFLAGVTEKQLGSRSSKELGNDPDWWAS